MASFRSIWLCVLASILLFAVGKADEEEPRDHQSRGADNRRPLHFKGQVHNSAYDYDALLGSEFSDELADLPEDVRITRLRNLAKTHDKNNNDIIEEEELQEWVLHSFRMLDNKDANDRRNEEDDNEDGKVAFSEVLKKQYGYSETEIVKFMEDGDLGETEGGDEILNLAKEDKIKFDTADLNKDGFLDENEYSAYSHPHDYPHMQDYELDRSMREWDSDKDGFITLQEFNRSAPPQNDEESPEDQLPEDDSNFKELDKNGDGKLDRDEMKPWAIYDSAEAAKQEAVHLIQEADKNEDGQLTIEEIVLEEEKFVESQATNFGHSLHFVKDEL